MQRGKSHLIRWREKGRAARRLGLQAAARFWEIDGDQRAAAFAYYAFFALFPLILIFVTVGSLFINRGQAAKEIIAYAESYVPLTAGMKHSVFNIVAGVVNVRGQAGVVALAVLFWVALGFFSALIRAVNRAWRCGLHNWWRMPLKSALLLAVMASTLVLGMGLPILAGIAQQWILPNQIWTRWIYRLADFLVPLLVLFYGLSLFYRLAPRRPTRFDEVWPAAVVITLLVRLLETLFVLYLSNFARFNAVYGTLGGVMALLVWIWLSGCLVVFGACLCAVRAEAANRLPAANAPGGPG